MALPEDLPETRYARSGDVHVAYQVSGRGPLDVVVVPGLFATIDAFYAENSEYQSFRRRLETFARLVIFDKRGTGSSDRVTGAPPLEERMDDLRAVLDAVASPSAAVLGLADGGAMSLLFAATYPERVVALALLRPKLRYVWAPDFPWAPTREDYERRTAELVERWGTTEELPFFVDGSRGDEPPERRRSAARALRLSASPGAVAALRRMNMDIDLRSVLPAVRVPTLVLHRSADAPDAAETNDEPNADYIARHVPLARVLDIGQARWFELTAIDDFFREAWAAHERTTPGRDRVLATVLFTDLVSSTAKALEEGPRWQEVLSRHNAVIRRELTRFRGREIETAGDGFFASGFDGPARAIRCGCAIRDAIGALGLGIRVGVHTGECDVVDGKLAGLAVHVGARVADQADEGEVLVSRTVRDLVAGSGIELAEKGARELKGLGEWTLFSVSDA